MINLYCPSELLSCLQQYHWDNSGAFPFNHVFETHYKLVKTFFHWYLLVLILHNLTPIIKDLLSWNTDLLSWNTLFHKKGIFHNFIKKNSTVLFHKFSIFFQILLEIILFHLYFLIYMRSYFCLTSNYF